MAISVSCPSCEAKLKVGDHLAGRKIKCPKCSETMPVPEESGETAVAAGKPRRGAAAAATGNGRASKARPDSDNTDEARPRKRAKQEDDDEVEDEDRPRRKKKKPEKSSKGMLIGLL